MKYILILFSITLVQCCTGKKTSQTTGFNQDSSAGAIIDSTSTLPEKSKESKYETSKGQKDTVPERKTPVNERSGNIDLQYGRFLVNDPPLCLRSYVKKIMDDEVKNPPQKIYRYKYNGRTVYYVTAPCCDFFTDLLDSDCKLIGHPDGGITGKGDGKMPDFQEKRSGETLVWEDPRLTR